jgi:hypothetical protein
LHGIRGFRPRHAAAPARRPSPLALPAKVKMGSSSTSAAVESRWNDDMKSLWLEITERLPFRWNHERTANPLTSACGMTRGI